MKISDNIIVESNFVDSGDVKLCGNEIIVYPQRRKGRSRGEEYDKGARLEIVIKSSQVIENFELTVDWELKDSEGADKHIKKYHDYAYISDGFGGCNMVVAEKVEDGRTYFKFSIPSGKLYFSHYPKFSLSELEDYLSRVNSKIFNILEYGKSENGRPLYVLSSGESSVRNLVVVARNHAYESAGSFCCNGIVDFLCSSSDVAKYLLNNFNVYILPMTNVDGVEEGMSRYTSSCGADLNRYITEDDAAHKHYISFLDNIKPDFLINYHNWQDKFVDGMWCYDEFYESKIKSYLSSTCGDFKKWNSYTVKGTKPVFEYEACSVQAYLESTYNIRTVTYEFPWFGRTTERMKNLGAESFIAAALTRLEEMQNS
jgi:hypothetical protein